MIIADLEHLEAVSQVDEAKGGVLPFDPNDFIGIAFSSIVFDSLVLGDVGSGAVGEINVLTTATAQGTAVGYTAAYSSIAVGPNGGTRRRRR